jgi:hypothetical protein
MIFPKWGQRRVVSEAHLPDLEHHAAMLEFGEGYDRDSAERQAHADYLRNHHINAAAHHLQGLRAAQANGDVDEAQKHGTMYGLHLQRLGADPLDGVPDEVRNLLTNKERKSIHKFKAHKADQLLLKEEESDESNRQSANLG